MAQSKSQKSLESRTRADLGTKHLDGGAIRRALVRCHCYIHEGVGYIREGRAGIAFGTELQESTRSYCEVVTANHECEVD